MSDEAAAPPPAAEAPRNNFADVAKEDMSTFSSSQRLPGGRGRVIAESTRAAFQAKAPAMARAVAEGAIDEDTVAIDADEPAEKAAPDPVAPRNTSTPSTEALAITAHHEAMARQLAERESKLTERERSTKDLVERFRDDPTETIRDIIREAHGLTSDDQVKEHAMDLVTDLSGAVLGLEVPEAKKAKLERKKAERLIREHNSRLSKDQAAVKAEREQIEKDRANAGYKQIIRDKLATVADKHPYLMAEDAPHELVWSVAEKLAETEPGWVPSWEDAARRAEKYLKTQADAYYSKRRHLLNPESTPKQPAKAATTPQERPPGSRSSVTLTNGQAQESSATTAPTRPLTNEDRRRSSLSKLRASIAADE